ncbi:perforin-1-like [Bombina bombina]|uniref:perforin-1-like n=1 Tax=Bombina bombina TaxID=8345 RepID=UPI00235AD90E|nr:perforin-1-like [Bombina bombina]
MSHEIKGQNQFTHKAMLLLIVQLVLHPISSCSGDPNLTYACQTGHGAQCKQLPFVPGHTLVGQGFNIVTMKPTKLLLIDVQSYSGPDEKCTLCHNPHMNNALQKLPMSVVQWRPKTQCTRKVSSKVSRSALSLIEESSAMLNKEWSASLDLTVKQVNAKVVLAGSQSELTKFTESKSSTDRYSFSSLQLTCSYYSFNLGDRPQLTRYFEKELNMLPTSFDDAAKIKYRQLIEKYGTHYMTSAEVGGQVLEVTALQTCRISMEGMTEEEIKDCLEIEASIAVADKGEASTKAKTCKELNQKRSKGESFHQTFSEKNWQVNGGKTTFGLLSFDSDVKENSVFDEWFESLKTMPDVLSYSLRPIHELVRFKGPQKENLRKAISAYIIENALQKNCSCPGSSQISIAAECSCVCHASPERGQNCCPTKKGLAKLVVTVKHANGLWGDYITSTDAYIKVSFGNEKRRTSTIWNNNNPIWNIRFDMGFVDLSSVFKLKVEIWDEDNKYDDDLLGACDKSLTSGQVNTICYAQHGRLTYSYNVTCVPHLSGSQCQDYKPFKE